MGGLNTEKLSNHSVSKQMYYTRRATRVGPVFVFIYVFVHLFIHLLILMGTYYLPLLSATSDSLQKNIYI